MLKKLKRKELILLIAAVYAAFFMLFLCKALFSDSLNYKVSYIAYGGVFKYHYFYIGGKKISLYWSAHIVGLAGMVLLCWFRRKRYDYSKAFSVITALLLAVMGFIGAKLLYIFENLNKVKEKGISMNGVSFFGTVFFMPLALLIISKIAKIDYKKYMDYCTPSGILMLTCIRTGCFLNGCCHGIFFWYNHRPVIFPSQLLECVLDLILLYIIYLLQDKVKDGSLYVYFMGGYGILRFIVEFTRNTEATVIGLSNGHIFSIICIVIMIVHIVIQNLEKTKTVKGEGD